MIKIKTKNYFNILGHWVTLKYFKDYIRVFFFYTSVKYKDFNISSALNEKQWTFVRA